MSGLSLGLDSSALASQYEQVSRERQFKAGQALIENVQYQPSVEAAIDFAQASSFGNFLSHLPTQRGKQARAEIAAELAQHLMREGIRQESSRLVALALEPAAA